MGNHIFRNIVVGAVGAVLATLVIWLFGFFGVVLNEATKREVANHLRGDDVFAEILTEKIASDDRFKGPKGDRGEQGIPGAGLTLGEATKVSEATAYQAKSDGFFVGLIFGKKSEGGVATISGYVGSTPQNLKVRTTAGITGHPQANWLFGQSNTFLLPIKNGNYYKGELNSYSSAPDSTERQYLWIPFTPKPNE